MGLRTEIRSLLRRDAVIEPRLIGFSPGSGVGAYGVTSTTALGLSAVWGCLDIIANAISQLDWEERRNGLEIGNSRLARRPQAEKTRREWTNLVVRTLALWDVCYLLKVGGLDSEGVPMSLIPLWPSIVSPLYSDDQWYNFVPPTAYWVGNRRVAADELVVLRRASHPDTPDWIAGVLRLARTTFAAALSAEAYSSRYWQTGGTPVAVLETDQQLQDPQAQAIGNSWAQARQRGPDHPAVLTHGLKARNWGADPTQESAVEARRELVADVGRYFGIPTRILNAPTGDSETYRNTSQANLDLVKYTLQNYIDAIEDGISDLLPGGRYVCIDPKPLYRDTLLAQAQAYQLLTTPGPDGRRILEIDEVREELGYGPSGVDDDALVPMTVQPAAPNGNGTRGLAPYGAGGPVP